MFCRVMAAYGLSDERTLRMPMRRFWLLEKNITRMRAEEDLRALPIVTATNATQEAMTAITERLTKELGTVVVHNVVQRDENAISKLKQLSGQAG